MSFPPIKNAGLTAARAAKKDEFYTQIADIEAEMAHYDGQFDGKVVYCNCDDHRVSNFVRYFVRDFHRLGLSKLISTCYVNRDSDLFSRHAPEPALKFEYDGTSKEESFLDGDGDFRSGECVEILKHADIAVTNPPFSMFRDYVALMKQHEKRLLIYGNINAIGYKEIFPLIRDRRICLGPSVTGGDREFGVPDDYPLTAAGQRIDENGNKFVRVTGVRWFTNIEHDSPKDWLVLTKRYSPEDYPAYDNFDAVEVAKTKDIPRDYSGVMGVPITFMDKWNPNQFEVLGMANRHNNSGLKTKHYSNMPGANDMNASATLKVGGEYRITFKRILIRRITPHHHSTTSAPSPIRKTR